MSGTVRKEEKGSKIDLESVKRYLEKGGGEDDKNRSTIQGMPLRFYERFILQGLHIDLIEPGRIICSLKVPYRLLNAGNFLHGGATASLVELVGSAVVFTVEASMKKVSLEINVSYLDAAYAGCSRAYRGHGCQLQNFF